MLYFYHEKYLIESEKTFKDSPLEEIVGTFWTQPYECKAHDKLVK